jgi:hypothetical protein
MVLASNLGRVSFKSAGEINYYSIVDSAALNVLSALDFMFNDDALKVIADAFNASKAKGIDITGVEYTRSLREFIGQTEADKILTELSLYGQYRKFPEVLNHTMLLSGMKMYYNKDMRSFIGIGTVGVNNFGKNPVNKQAKAYIEVGKRRSGDLFNIYLEPEDNHWYFFSYANGTMQVISSNKELNEKLTGLKEDQRVIKGEKGEPGYQFIIGTNDKKAVFLRKMKQLEAGE